MSSIPSHTSSIAREAVTSSITSSINELDSSAEESYVLSTSELLCAFEELNKEIDKAVYWFDLSKTDLFDEGFNEEWQRLVNREYDLRTSPPKESVGDDFEDFLEQGARALLLYCSREELQNCLLSHCQYTIEKIHEVRRTVFSFTEVDQVTFEEKINKLPCVSEGFTREDFKTFTFIYFTYAKVLRVVQEKQKADEEWKQMRSRKMLRRLQQKERVAQGVEVSPIAKEKKVFFDDFAAGESLSAKRADSSRNRLSSRKYTTRHTGLNTKRASSKEKLSLEERCASSVMDVLNRHSPLMEDAGFDPAEIKAAIIASLSEL